MSRLLKQLGPEEFPLIEQVYYPNHKEMVRFYRLLSAQRHPTPTASLFSFLSIVHKAAEISHIFWGVILFFFPLFQSGLWGTIVRIYHQLRYRTRLRQMSFLFCVPPSNMLKFGRILHHFPVSDYTEDQSRNCTIVQICLYLNK